MIHYEIYGLKRADAPTVVMSAGLGGAGRFWAPQIGALARDYRVIVYDHAGTGKSPAVLSQDPSQAYSISHMARDVIEVMDEIGVTRADIVGHALGALVGFQLALDHPERVGRLVAINGWAAVEPVSLRCFQARLALLEHGGDEAWVRAQPIFLYPAAWLHDHHAEIEQEINQALQHFPGAANTRARVQALSAFDIRDRLVEMDQSVLLLATRDDVLVPWQASQKLVEGLSHGQLTLFEQGGHGVTVTMPNAVNHVLLDFLGRPSEVSRRETD